ncbi:DUF4097 family beta strand repeat-containing protein [Lactobacillus sp. ESL0677]|uniref:DUF4097 family beta strand repeat-containing protein n=1 Tax=Lactobacillus sp. ESL0677 TaxID=2983208 RepID=UPI0023F956A1|nr:DUF4097 family beta strand repeat-containing protein [Lactobacillus sp. ESL0677]WEV36969.1 DUF4097 family beta strand repeat-containing protein [Lactobacillus sp. ESL0677]
MTFINQMTHTIPAATFTNIKINVKNATVTITAATSYQVTLTDTKRQTLHAEVNGNELIVTESDVDIVQLNLLHLYLEQPRIEITIPSAVSLDMIEINDCNGSVNLAAITCSNLALELKNGASKLNGLKVTGQVALKTANGSVTITQSSLPQTMLRIANGSIKINHSQLTLDARLKNGGAKIDASQLLGQNILKLTNGGVRITQADPTSDYQLSTVAGHVRCFANQTGRNFTSDNHVKITTITGGITIS